VRRISIGFLMAMLAFAALSAQASAGGCVNETPPTAGTDPAVAIAKCQFTSGLLRVPVGTTVTWTNADFLPHEISGVGWGRTQSMLMPGETFSHMFDRSGVYPYFCPLHPGMAAVVFVGEASTAAGPPSSATKVAATAPAPAEPGTNGAWLATALLVSILVGVTSFAAGRYLGR